MDSNPETLRLYSIFNSVDGEVNYYGQGCFSTFIRLAGCNLACEWCFGVKPSRRIPRIITSQGSNKKLPEVAVGDKLMTFDDDLNLVETKVTKVMSRVVDKWLQIKIEGKTYFVTEEHPFFTNRGLIPASNLVVGDMILHSSSKSKISFSKMGDKNPMKNPEVAKKSAQNTDYVVMGKTVSNTLREKQRLGTYKSTWESMSPFQKLLVKTKHSNSMKGDKNPNWKGGVNPNYNRLKALCSSGKITKCKMCKMDKELLVHHIDENDKNDDPDNLLTICHSCHSSSHQIGYNFWNTERKDGKVLNRMKDLNGYEVQEIKHYDRNNYPPSTKPDPLKVYNLSCSPYNTYLIDHMWVHNCDTKYANKPHAGMDVSIKTILKEVDAIGCKKVTITGGEPLFQANPLSTLTKALWQAGYKITVETNGSFSLGGIYGVNSWIVDYKTLSSDMSEHMLPDENFLALSANDYIKFVIAEKRDYLQARGIVARWGRDVHAKIAFSPIQNIHVVRELLGWMKRDKLFNVIFNLQLHKWVDIEESR